MGGETGGPLENGRAFAQHDQMAFNMGMANPSPKEGQRIRYNFVKPHMALEGQTPAQVAGVGIGAKNKWLAMLAEAVNNRPTISEHERGEPGSH